MAGLTFRRAETCDFSGRFILFYCHLAKARLAFGIRAIRQKNENVQIYLHQGRDLRRT